ncbi:DUF5694 domain-containing protein [Limnovirga soli]|uniref:TraB/GumN family protein n=1 Tax=Limnovirga soli TaxID=2656915 RepID=A0A8J8FFZ5_9BACT|nr:DUF5694 domain-containing protein [Limnovirga soli]NNV57345.1 hypothetical protein [Limnovirga soli]
MTNFRTQFLLVGFLLTSFFLQAQKIKDPDDFLIPKGVDSLPKIFLLGSFHFEYPNLDANKVDKSKQIDILSEQKQKELQKLLDYIAIFRPTKICIEAPVQWNAMEKYRMYKTGKKELGRDEIQQIAFRLMDRFKLDTVYCVDASTIADDLSESKDSTVIKPYIDEIFKDYSFKAIPTYKKWIEYETEQNLKVPLFEYFKYFNSQKRFLRDYGYYLSGEFKNGKYNGADALATYWYDRNLRIFRNIQRITTSSNDRILVLFGAGHISILDQLLKCTPEYNYIKFDDLKNQSNR